MATERRDDRPEEVDLSALEDDRDYAPTGRQRSARTDPSMRDGDSGHGNPNEYATDDAEPTSDNDVGDAAEEPAYGGSAGGAVGGTPAEKRSSGGTLPEGHEGMTGSEARGDSTIGTRDADLAAAEPAGSLADAAAQSGPEAAQTDNADERARGERRAEPREPDLPIKGYKHLTVTEVIQKAKGLSPEELRQLREFEARHRHRKTLLVRLDRMMDVGKGKGRSVEPAARKTGTPRRGLDEEE
jgi:hypothetical protein